MPCLFRSSFSPFVPSGDAQSLLHPKENAEAAGTLIGSKVGRMRYTSGMKTAISIPDDVFQAAERLAKRQKKSRSQLYAEAVRQYTARHSPDEITDAINRSLDDAGEDENREFVAEAARRTLINTEW